MALRRKNQRIQGDDTDRRMLTRSQQHMARVVREDKYCVPLSSEAGRLPRSLRSLAMTRAWGLLAVTKG